MVVAGFFLKGNLVRISTLTGDRQSHSPVSKKINKLGLVKNPSQAEVAAFVMTLKAFCSDHAVDKIVVNRRAASGRGAGGAGTFLIEGILLAASPVPIDFVHSATVAATNKKEVKLKLSRPDTADLRKAYDLAYEGLS